MKRILHVTGSLRVGGLETVAMNCVRYSSRAEYQYDFVVFGDKIDDYEDEAKERGCRIFHISSPKEGYFSFYQNIKKIIAKYGPYDTVHSHTFFNSGFIMRAAYVKRVPQRISHAHSVGRKNNNGFLKKFYQKLMRKWMIKYSTKFCACSEQAGVYLFTSKYFSKKGQIFPNVINVRKFLYSADNRKKIRDEFDIGEDKIVIGNVGHLSKEKNQKFILLVIGDGSLKEELVEYAKCLSIEKNVLFLGTRLDVSACLSAMDCFLCTSIHEGFGLVLLEAMVNGLQCLVENRTLVDEIRYLNKCQIVNGFDEKLWSAQIIDLIRKRNYSEDGNFLINSKYSDIYFTEFISELYSGR